MGKNLRLAMTTLAILGLLAGGLALYGKVISRANAAVTNTSPVMDWHDHADVLIMNPQERGTSDLVRTVDGLSMNIDTVDLPIGSYTMWLSIYNNPDQCSNGDCQPLVDTGAGGIPNPAEGSILWLTAGYVGPDRMGHFSSRVGLGEEGAPGVIVMGSGVTNPMGAELHLILRYHGPTMWDDMEMLSAQATQLHGGCTKGGGPFECY